MKATSVQIILSLGVNVAFLALLMLAPAPRTISLTDEGFYPRALTIRAGESVTFRNERSKYFWPASDFHPTHALFPAFDSAKPLAPGASWSFTFDAPGGVSVP